MSWEELSMSKDQNDFNQNEVVNKDYTKSAEFLLEYCWKGKTKEQIIVEMDLPDYEQVFLDAAINELTPLGKFTGMDLDQFIVQRLDEEDEDIGELNDPDIIYLKRG